ncbi:MAG: hypothetical protein IKA37_00165 [Spirochaetales bacterium]|nr:hypothetical protein [Spirochaetales bacterium]MBR2316363.1 hypothetical protein [Spirochaetales bacterium]
MKKVKVTIIAIILTIVSISNIIAKPQKMIYIEQVYRLYESNLLSNQTNYKRNIFWLENSLKLVNAHPSQAIIVTNTWEEYVKYKLLLRFHIYYLLTKEYMGWGWEYDKRDVVFYNAEWAEEIKNSFEIAKSRYDIAKHYWEKTKLYAQEINKIDVHIGWEQIEDLAYEIDNQEFDYDYDEIIEMRLDSIDNKLAKLDSFLIKNNE